MGILENNRRLLDSKLRDLFSITSNFKSLKALFSWSLFESYPLIVTSSQCLSGLILLLRQALYLISFSITAAREGSGLPHFTDKEAEGRELADSSSLTPSERRSRKHGRQGLPRPLTAASLSSPLNGGRGEQRAQVLRIGHRILPRNID